MSITRRTLVSSMAGGLVAVLATVGLSVPAAAGTEFDTVQATLTPAGDPDGSGTAVLEIDTKNKSICYQIHTENVSTPIMDATITFGESGETVAELIVIDNGPVLEECVRVFGPQPRRDLNRISKDPGNYFLHLFNEEHPSGTGAVQGQLVGVS